MYAVRIPDEETCELLQLASFKAGYSWNGWQIVKHRSAQILFFDPCNFYVLYSPTTQDTLKWMVEKSVESMMKVFEAQSVGAKYHTLDTNALTGCMIAFNEML